MRTKLKPSITRLKNSLLFLGLLLLCNAFSFGQQHNINFKYLTVDNGLSQNNINCIIQDSKGFMWFGTQDGLNKFDGYNIKIFGQNSDSVFNIKGKHINDIIEDQDGNMWFGTWANGLSKYSHTTGKFESFIHTNKPNSLSINHVSSIHEYNDSLLWIGTYGGGLNLFNKLTKTFKSYQHSDSATNSLSSNIVSCIELDENNKLWIGTQQGLNMLNPQNMSFTTISLNSELQNQINDILCDKQGTVWIATNDGLLEYQSNKNTSIVFKNDPSNINSISSNRITCIYQDHFNRLWFGTENGLNLFDKITKEFKHYTNNKKTLNSINDNLILSISEDKSGVIWVGTKTGGINYFESTPKGFKSFSNIPNNLNSLSKNDVRCFCEETPNKIWVGTLGGGLNLFNKQSNSYKLFKHNPNNPTSISNDQINSIYKDSRGTLWVATRDGLNIFNSSTKSFKAIKHNSKDTNSISNNWVNVIYEDKNNHLWFGTEGGGLNKYDYKTKKFTTFNHPIDNRVRSIWQDNSGKLWIGTMKGLSTYNPTTKQFIQYVHNPNDPTSISSNIILSIFEDELNHIWIGTVEGLNLYDSEKNSFKRYTTKDGLPNNVIYGILSDQNKNLWISTNKGVSRFNIANHEFRNHDFYDGLPGIEFNYGAYLKLSTGEMLFGGTNGFTLFNPENIKYNTYKPPVLITDLKIFNKTIIPGEKFNERLILEKSIYETEEVELTYKDYIITFEFTAFNYISPDNNKYAYKLEGLEEEWNYVNNRRFATYTTLPAGNYTFKVKASNNDGVWNNQEASINLIVTPPYWNTWQFRVIAGLVILSLVFIYIRFKMSSIKAQNKTLENKVNTRTRDLYEVNTQLEENQVELELKQEEIKAQRDAIEEQNNELRKLTIVASETDNAITICDANGNFEWVNDGLFKLFGYTLEERSLIHGKNIFEASTNPNISQIIEKAKSTKESVIYESSIKTKDGVTRNLQTTLTPYLDENKEIKKLIFIDTDITDLKQAEKEIREKNEEILTQKQELEKHRNHLESLVKERTRDLEIAKEKAEESDRLKTSFLTNMSHEIRTPMNAIIGFSTLLGDDYLEQDEKNKLISEITTNTYSLLNLIDNILEIARLDTKQFDIKPGKIDVNQTLNEIYNSYTDLINLKNIKFLLNTPDDSIEIISDNYRLKQVFKNLIDNAIKFTNQGVIELGYTVLNNQIEFFVKDTGIGMSADYLQHIFGRFTKIEDNKKKLYRGAGLGLAICKNIIELLHGHIWVESEAKTGSNFYFTLPYHSEKNSTPKNTNITKQILVDNNWANKTILIAEDEDSNFNYIQLLLRKTNTKIIRAENGKDAIEKTKEFNPDLILMDIKMPIMDGLEATKIIKHENPTIKIISVSAFSTKSDIEQSKEAGCIKHLTKPLQKTTLLETLKIYLS